MLQEKSKDRDRFSLETIFYVVVGLIFFSIFLIYSSEVFPTASIRLDVTKREAQDIAAKFLKTQGYDLSNYQEVEIFDSDDLGAMFLQKNLGMKSANEIMRDKVPIWRWRCRWFRPEEQEEFKVSIDPSGRIVTFNHEIEENKAGVTISHEEAEKLASDFLIKIIGLNLSHYERIEASTEKLANRTDHYFEWKLKDFEISSKGGSTESEKGTNRVSVCVQGNRIGSFYRYFKIPEAFGRDYTKTKSEGILLGDVSLVLMILIVIASLIVFIIKYKKNDIRLRFPLCVSLLIGVLFLIDWINSFQQYKAGYSTATDYNVYFGTLMTDVVLGAIIVCIVIFFAGTSGEALTREVYPNSLGTLEQLMKGRVFTRSFFFSSIRGYALGFFSLGYVTLFYMIGQKYLGVFIPAEGPYSNLLGTYLPWLAPLSVSLSAAVSEEFLFRMFSISFLKRYLKWTPAALFIPAAIWAFGHSTYEVFPTYVRGIELTIEGIIFGLFFIRFGIMTCIIAHYVFDAIVIGLPLLQSGNTYYIISGAVVCLLAVVPIILGIPGLLHKTNISQKRIRPAFIDS